MQDYAQRMSGKTKIEVSVDQPQKFGNVTKHEPRKNWLEYET